jgi:putative ABC transport system permease protein
VTLASAQSDISAVAAAMAQEFPATNKGRGVVLEPAHDTLIGGELRRTALLFLGVVGFVMLICCANVANLLLARATVRARELAVRSALGAGRRRVIRQLLTESLVLAAIGGAAGLALGAAILRIAPTLIPQGLLPNAVTLTFDVRVIAFCAFAALAVAVLFGVAPAWQATGLSSTHVIAADSRTVVGRGGRLRALLVVGEVATAALLLFGGGLLLRSLLAVEQVDGGYRAQQVLTMLVDPLGSKYPTRESLLQFLDEVEREVRAIPGVASTAWTTAVPLGPDYDYRVLFDIVGDPPVEDTQRPTANYQIVSSTYFDTFELPIVAGREFASSDTGDSVPVCIVNEGFARKYLRGRSPIGAQVVLRTAPTAKPTVREIVGVARQVKGRLDEADELVQVYVPLLQNPLDDVYLAVRPASGRADTLTSAVRAAVARVDKEQLVSVRDIMTLEDIEWAATGRHRFRAVLVMTFATLALLLAMVGVFGILSYSVQQRIRDFGVRRALGATTNDLIRLVMRTGVRLVGTGLAIGLVLSALLGRLLTTLLFGVKPFDPITFVAVTVLLALTAAMAVAGPARRATRIDPAAALRGE